MSSKRDTNVAAKSGTVLEQLREEGEGGNGDGLAFGEAVEAGEGRVADDLERMSRAECLLVVAQRLGRGIVRGLRLDEEPRHLVARHEEVDFALLLVPDVMQSELAIAQVRPALDRLEQVAGDHRLEPLSGIGHASPVSQEPLRRLANGILDVAEPRAHLESVVEALEDADPALDRLFVGLHLAGERPVDDLFAASISEQFGENGELPEFHDAREVAYVVAQKLLVA